MLPDIHEYLISIDPSAWGYLLLGFGAFVEYVFPPFPGDVVVVSGAVLAGSSGWSSWLVILVTILGSLAGMGIDHAFGNWVHIHDAGWRERHRLWARIGRGIDRLLPLYRKHPKTLLVLNRFMPSVRALIFVAAGMEKTPRRLVIGLGGLSALVWMLLLFLIGYLVGRDFEELVGWVERWSITAGILLALAIAVWLWRQFHPSRRGSRN